MPASAWVLACVLAVARTAAAAEPVVHAAWRVVSQPAGGTGRTELALAVTVDPGWHVNAHEPSQAYLIPTALEIDAPPTARVATVGYPEPVVRSLAFAGGAPLKLYEGSFTITAALDGPRVQAVSGRLRYQACSDDRCLPPATMPVTLALADGGGAVLAAAVNDANARAAGGGHEGARFEQWMRERGLVATVALAMVLGLALNLTPCVYPLISVTIAYFGSQAGHSTWRVVRLACAYVLGIALSFSALGVSAALSGGLFGSALQRPLVLTGVALLLVALAGSSFGLYQVRVPAGLLRGLGRASGGLLGALLMGLTMGVVAAPCVGPIVVALLLFVAAHQDAALGFVLFFALAIGMGAPYVALAVGAGSIRRLPRSGEWLAWVEHLFGFVLLGMALYFVGPLLGERATEGAIAALVALAGLYLGFLDRAGRALAGFATVRRALGVTALVAAAWLALPRAAESAIAWEPFSSTALAVARGAGKPAIVDFTASWCLPCRENDALTFRDAAVRTEAERFAMLRADVTEMTPEVEEWLARYNVLGVPTILFYGANGTEEARTVGFVEPRTFLGVMRERR